VFETSRNFLKGNIGCQLLDEGCSHDWQILATHAHPWGERAPSHWINSGKREGREGECLKTCSHVKHHS